MAFIILSVKVVYFVCKYIIFDVSTMSWCFGLSFENLRNFKVSDRPRVMGLLYPKACQAWAMGGTSHTLGAESLIEQMTGLSHTSSKYVDTYIYWFMLHCNSSDRQGSRYG